MDQNEDLPSSHPVQQVFTVSQDLRLTSCLRVTQFYKTILNLQRFWDASRMMKTRPLSGKQSRAHHFEPWLKTQGVDSFTSGCSKDLTSRYFKTFSPIERAFSQFPAPSTDWPGCRYYGNSKLSLLYLRSSLVRSSVCIQNKVLKQMWGFSIETADSKSLHRS